MTRESRSRLAPIIIFHFALFIYPVISFAWRRNYPVLSGEFLLLALAALLAAVLVGVVLARIRPMLANAISAVLVCLCFLVQFNLYLPGLLICLSAVALLAWRSGPNFHRFGVILMVALLVGAFLDARWTSTEENESGESPSERSGLPPVVHLILDSAIGTGGLPVHPASSLMQEEILSLYTEYGFKAFPKAYSHYSQTGDSMYSAFNYQAENVSRFSLETAADGRHFLSRNAHLDAMNSLGYRFRFYQTDHLDYCRSQGEAVDRCWNYQHPNVSSIRQAKGSSQRLIMLASVIINQSELLTRALNSYGLLLNLGIAVHDPEIFEQLQKDMAGDNDGTYTLAHILLPHGPFAYMNDCSVNYDTPMWARYANMANEPRLPDWTYEVRNARYFEQLDCALGELRSLFKVMKEKNIFDQSIILIHGDHGSMISVAQPHASNRDQLTKADLMAAFSVMFAVKAPSGEFGSDPRTASLPTLMEGAGGLINASATGQHYQGDLSEYLPGKNETGPQTVYLTGEFPLVKFEVELFGE